MVDIWRGLHTLTFAKRREIEKPSKNSKWPLSGDDLELFANQNQAQSDKKLASILALSLEQKFLADLGLDAGNKSDHEILNIIEPWATENVRNNDRIEFKTEIVYESSRDTCPYATIFVLFLCGQHSLALKYCKEFASAPFQGLYSDYVTKYRCQGVPKDLIVRYNQTVLLDAQFNDVYHDLIVNIMLGCYRDDPQYQDSMLF